MNEIKLAFCEEPLANALLEVVRLLGLDRYDINKQLTSAGLQLRGKSVSEAGRLPRTTKEYDFVNKNQELNEDYEKISRKRLKPTIIEKKTKEKAKNYWM